MDNIEQYGLNKKSFSMYFGGGEIWLEHLDGIHDLTDLAIQKLEKDYLQFKKPSMPSLIAINIDETTITDDIINSIVEKLLDKSKRFTRVVLLVLIKNIEKR